MRAPRGVLAGLARLVAVLHGLRARRHGPERALQRVGVGRARRGRREAVARAHALGQRRVGLVAAPLAARVAAAPAPAPHRAEAGRADGDGRQAAPRRVLPRRRR